MSKKNDKNGLFIPAGLLLGIGLGFLFNQVVAGTLIGLGVGFLTMAIMGHCKKDCCGCGPETSEEAQKSGSTEGE